MLNYELCFITMIYNSIAELFGGLGGMKCHVESHRFVYDVWESVGCLGGMQWYVASYPSVYDVLELIGV